MDTARMARVLMKSTNIGTLTLVTKHHNDFFPVSQKIDFCLTTEGEILIYLDNLEMKNRGIKEYNRAGLYVCQSAVAVEIMGRLVALPETDLRKNRMASQFFSIHKDLEKFKEAPNYAFYILKNDFARYFFDPQHFESLSYEGIKCNPPISPIELSHIASEFSEHNISMIDGDGYYSKRENEEMTFHAFEKTLASIDEVHHEISELFRKENSQQVII